MKVFLTIVMCSTMAQTCIEPHTFPNSYNDIYDCLVDGYSKANNKIIEIGREEINKHQIYIKFDCQQLIIPPAKPGVSS